MITAKFWTRAAATLALLAAVAGCERLVILEGERLDIRAPWGGGAEVVNRAVPITLPAAQTNADWTHRQGQAGRRPAHPALSAAPQLAWSAAIGDGDTRRERLTTDPVVAGGRIFTLDSRARVQATSTNGEVIWSRDLTPEWGQRSVASGGGLAVDGGRLYVTSAYGFLSALDAATGAEIWTHRFDAPAKGAPMISGGRVYVSVSDSTLWSLDAANGRVQWTLRGSPSLTVMARGPVPAISGDLVLFPTQAGEIEAVRRNSSAVAWNSVVTGRRTGAAYSTISAITGDPVVDGNRVYAANHSGQLVALNVADGSPIWTAREAAYAPVWPVGGSVFLVSDENRLLRLDARSGQPIWAVQLPLYTTDRPRNRGEIFPQHGPVLAGGRLWVASGDGVLRGYDPVSGALVHDVAIPGGAASGPVVAGGTLYVLARDGRLHAFR